MKLSKNSFISGSLIASICIVITKVLGALYVIPFYKIIGPKGGALYSYAYNIYVLFLNISYAGLPVAISKIISEYNSLEYYYSKELAFKIGKRIVTIISFICFLILFIFSKSFAYLIIGNNTLGNTIDDISLVIKCVSFCLLIIPFLSVTKGYLQGHKFISVTSISEVIEQLFRIFIILFGSFLVINILKKEISIGVSVSISGAFFGGLISYLYLKYKMNNNKDKFIKDKVNINDNVSKKEIIKKIITYSLPLIITSVVTNIYSMTDLSLIIRGLSSLGYKGSEVEEISSIISTWGNKICVLIQSVSLGISVSLIPNIVSDYVKGDKSLFESKVLKSISMVIFLSLPMSVFISLNSKYLYTLFYGYSEYGIIVLKYLVFVSFLSSMHLVLNMILQGLNEYRIIYLNTIIGFLINGILDIPLMKIFNLYNIYPYYGAITSSIIGYSLSITIIIVFLKKKYDFKFKNINNILIKMILPLIIVFTYNLIINKLIILNHNRLIQIPILILNFLISSWIYLFIAYKFNLLNIVFGDNLINKIKSKISAKYV